MLETAQEIESYIAKAPSREKKKAKTTIYLTEEAEEAFTELYIHRLRKNRKIDRSTIACEAIHLLFEKECRPNLS